MNTFEDPGFDASEVVAVKTARSQFESLVYSEVMMYYLEENARRLDAGIKTMVRFKDEQAMFEAYWAEVLG